jgi:hypothetical protein
VNLKIIVYYLKFITHLLDIGTIVTRYRHVDQVYLKRNHETYSHSHRESLDKVETSIRPTRTWRVPTRWIILNSHLPCSNHSFPRNRMLQTHGTTAKTTSVSDEVGAQFLTLLTVCSNDGSTLMTKSSRRILSGSRSQIRPVLPPSDTRLRRIKKARSFLD